MSALEITVRGRAERQYRPEQGTVTLAASFTEPTSESAHAKALALQSEVVAELTRLDETDALNTWHANDIHVFGHRPWVDGKQSRKVLYTTRIAMTAEFLDFEALAAFLVDWAGRDGLTVGHIAWDVRVENRRSYEVDVRREAVGDAVAKAQAYADAVGRGTVVAVALADPDMLGTAPNESVGPMMMRAAGADMGAGPTLELRPDDVVIAAAVDARFTASD
ncbi:MAG TPA: SIMPL domain-containing protein [Gordonia sp. (in: high G+C Gram-positive bacteria)]|mgnify:CR=1 FL=1|uniref:SIMPL domain-containing protein n=1 Tax=unclassified Gordonia (in: high G+C Gram-positive bacteria) TaxID=2657482 RepID=UPI000FC33D2B|nr:MULTISPECIES: SIMPL domain-containing protein [unclassified Gordonia (in: high G+C Gram-positive bacteria)]RUP41415.1 MAG: SIMPL domain-containing protein [Gordonia sp. (in: high G+C Gram-positive bacteria)]HNP57919.1 SIMPL domain-containing protein [Gordonia sp. (in: high G+C Gram-positive bacteria)]HRC51487.1 SIMPL domain-containing protein [Gordonia sp. (in: high G+C Gram-positive bacteria)]